MEVGAKGKYDLTTKARLAPSAICDLQNPGPSTRVLLIKTEIQKLKVSLASFSVLLLFFIAFKHGHSV